MSTPVAAASPKAVNDDAFLRAVALLGAGQPVKTSRPIYNTLGELLLAAGVPVDKDLHDRLSSHRLAAPLDESVEADTSVDSAALREAAEAALQRWPFFAQMGPPGRMRSMLLDAIGNIPLPKPIALHLTLARANKPALYEHSVLMALLCAHLVHEGGGLRHDVRVAAAAGLLHDIGMLYIDADLLDSGDLLDSSELKPLYDHSMQSALIIRRFPEYSKELLRAVVEHHERLDGSGYPRALAGKAISPLGLLLSLAEVVTAMFDGDRQYPEQRVSLLLRINPRRYDPALIPSIHRLLRALPPPEAGATVPVAESIDLLRKLDALLTDWIDTVAALTPQLEAAQRLHLDPVLEQTETLQRMLYEAGITPDQLGMVADEAAGHDPALPVELWALGQELQWQLRATAKQVQRRWNGDKAALTMPPQLAAWLDRVKALGPPAKA